MEGQGWNLVPHPSYLLGISEPQAALGMKAFGTPFATQTLEFNLTLHGDARCCQFQQEGPRCPRLAKRAVEVAPWSQSAGYNQLKIGDTPQEHHPEVSFFSPCPFWRKGPCGVAREIAPKKWVNVLLKATCSCKQGIISKSYLPLPQRQNATRCCLWGLLDRKLCTMDKFKKESTSNKENYGLVISVRMCTRVHTHTCVCVWVCNL